MTNQTEDFVQLKQNVMAALTQNGTIPGMKAQLRHAIHTLLHSDQPLPISAEIEPTQAQVKSSTKRRIEELSASAEGRLSLTIFSQFLSFLDVDPAVVGVDTFEPTPEFQDFIARYNITMQPALVGLAFNPLTPIIAPTLQMVQQPQPITKEPSSASPVSSPKIPVSSPEFHQEKSGSSPKLQYEDDFEDIPEDIPTFVPPQVQAQIHQQVPTARDLSTDTETNQSIMNISPPPNLAASTGSATSMTDSPRRRSDQELASVSQNGARPPIPELNVDDVVSENTDDWSLDEEQEARFDYTEIVE